MIRENLFYKILSGIHIVFFTSLLCGLTILLSGTILLLPAFGAIFQIGKDYINKELNINDSIIKTYFVYLKDSLTLLKFFPVNLLVILNVIGMYVAFNTNYMIYAVLCLAVISFLFLFMLYICGYYVFVDKKVNLIEVAICMVLKPQFLIPLFAILVVFNVFVSLKVLAVLLCTGSFFLFALEVVIFIQSLYFKKLNGNLSEEDEFAYLVYGKKKKK